MVCVQGHLAPNQPLDVAQIGPLVLFVAQRDGDAFRSRPARAANAVHIGFRDVGNLEVDHVAQVVHVNSTCGDVCGHKHTQIAALESLHRLLALWL